MCVETLREKAARKLKFKKENFKKFKKWNQMVLLMKRKLSAYSGIQKVMEWQLLKASIQQNIET